VVAETAAFAKAAAVMNEVDHGPDISRGDQLASRDGIPQVAEFEIQKVLDLPRLWTNCAIVKPLQIAAVRPAPHIRTVGGRLEQMRCVLFWPWAC
jgi:hypothetical protein